MVDLESFFVYFRFLNPFNSSFIFQFYQCSSKQVKKQKTTKIWELNLKEHLRGNKKKFDQDLELKIQKRYVQNQAAIPIPWSCKL